MTLTKRELIGAAVALVLLAVFAICWQREREAAVRAGAIAAAKEDVVAAKDTAIRDRDKLDAQYRDALTQQAAQLRTPAQAAQVLVKYMPPAAAQPIATVAPAELPAELRAKLPDAPSYGILTDLQLKQVATDELSCDATRHQLAACTADAVDLRTEVKAKSDEAAAWKSAAKGGTKWQRFGRITKSIACAAGGAGIGALAAKQNPSGAAIGAAAGVTACSLF